MTGTLRRRGPSFTTLAGMILGAGLLLLNKKKCGANTAVRSGTAFKQLIKRAFLSPGAGVCNHDLGVVLGLKGERFTVQ